MKSDIMKKYNLKNGGYGWIDHVSIENVYEISLEDEEDDKWVDMYDNKGEIIANANISYCNEVGYCEYDKQGLATNNPVTIYEYEDW